MKIGLDVHGVVDTFPSFFAEMSKLFVEAGHEVHIIIGLRQKEIEPELEKLGIRWTHFFSMTDYHEGRGTPMTYGPKNNPWMNKDDWERTKGDYARNVGLDIHFDDSNTYGKYFFYTDYIRIEGIKADDR